jgi:MFS family permease
MLGGVVFGFIGDKFGRVKSMIFSILLYAIFTGLAGLAQSWEQLAVCRFLTGLGIGGELVSIATFLSEVWPERSRAIAIGVLITSYQAGVFLAGAINLFFSNWRTVFFIGAIPALLVIVLRLTLKESEKWMQDQKMHSHTEEQKTPLKEILNRENAKNLIIGSLAFGGLLVGYWASLSWIPTWVQSLLTTPGNQERSIVTIYQGLAAIIGCSTAGFLFDSIGRKKTLLISFVGCFASSALLFLSNKTFSQTIYFETALLGYFIGLAQAAMYIYLPELFKTRVRASGVGLCLNSGRFLTIIAVLFIGPLVGFLGGYGQAAFAFSFSYVFGILASLICTETKGQSLPD